MKKITGINPDYSDFDELDQDALDAVEEFSDGQISYDELKSLIGTEAANTLRVRVQEHDLGGLFDDPESF